MVGDLGDDGLVDLPVDADEGHMRRPCGEGDPGAQQRDGKIDDECTPQSVLGEVALSLRGREERAEGERSGDEHKLEARRVHKDRVADQSERRGERCGVDAR